MNYSFLGSKERDAETGLDFFGARYFSSVHGRFTSADPIFFQNEMPTDPQRFNLYSYVRNNPLRFIDPKGEAIELLGTEDERKRALAAIQSAVGKEAGAYLYVNSETDKDGNTRYFVGVRTGIGKDFKDINPVAGEIAPIIADTKIVGIQVVEQGTKVGHSIFSTNQELCKCGATASAGTLKEQANYVRIFFAIPNPGDAYDRAGIDSTYPVEMENAAPGKRDIGTVMGHELGHARAIMTGAALHSEQSKKASLRLENKVRGLKGPEYSQRQSHGPDDAIRKQ